MQLVGKNIYLKKVSDDDTEDLFSNYWSSEKTAKYMLWTPSKNLDEARVRMAKTIEFQSNNEAYGVFDSSTNKAIGLISFKEVEQGIYEDCGLGLGEEYVNRTYGTQALKLMIEYLFNECNATRINVSCFEENIPSIKMIDKCGFIFTNSGKITDSEKKDYQIDYVSRFYKLDKSDYEQLN